MPTHLRRISTALVLLLALGVAASGEPSGPAVKPRTDPFGDPLPAGALARLGTVRFRITDYPVAALSPDAKVWAVFNRGDTVRLLNTDMTQEIAQFKVNRAGSNQLTFSPDGRTLAVGGFNGIQLYDARTGQTLQTIPVQQRGGRASLTFSADGKYFTLGSDYLGSNQAASLSVWEAATGKAFGPFTVLQNYGVSGALSSDGKLLATWGRHLPRSAEDRQKEQEISQTVQLWDVPAGKELRRLRADTYLAKAALSPDGKTLATASGGSTITLWDTASGKEIRRFAGRQGIGHFLAFSADGKTLAAASQDGVVQRWDTATAKRLGVCEGPKCRLAAVCFTPDGKAMAWGYLDQTVCLWDADSGKLLTPLHGHQSQVTGLAFSPSGKELMSASQDGKLYVWDPASGKDLRQAEVRPPDPYGRSPSAMSKFAFSPDGVYLAVADRNTNSIRLLEQQTRKEVCAFEARAYDVTSLTFSADGGYLAAAGRGKAVHLWNVETGQVVRQLDVPQGESSSVAIAPDGKTLAVAVQALDRQRGGYVSQVRLLDITSGKELHQLPTPEQVQSIAFSPDGSLLATVGPQPGAFKVWDTASGKVVRPLTGFSGHLTAPVAFAPNGRLVAVASINNSVPNAPPRVQVWEVASGGMRREFTGHSGMVSCLAFSPDGRALATGGADTTVLLWDLGGRLRNGPSLKARLEAAELEELWSSLAAAEAGKVGPVLQQLAAAPADTVAFLARHLKPVEDTTPSAEQMAKWIAELDADNFGTREAATRKLEQQGKAVEAALKKALAGNPAPEQRRRIDAILEKISTPEAGEDMVRLLRALEVLETIGTTEAQQLLTALAKGKPDAPLTRQAGGALQRLKTVEGQK
jgi:WD40 repeat protein